MKLKLICLLITYLLAATWVTAASANSASPLANNSKQDFFHTFNGSLPAALARAKKDNKFGLVLFFGTEHCHFCRRMKATVFNQEPVQKFYRQHFQIFDIDIESEQIIKLSDSSEATHIAFAKSKRIRLTPTLIFMDKEGEVVYKHIGIIADPLEFIWLGEYVVRGETSKQNFASYKMKKRRTNTQ